MCRERNPNDPSVFCGNDFEAFKDIVSAHQRSSEYLALDHPETVILTNEKDVNRLTKIEKLGWKLIPCLAHRCRGNHGGDGSYESVTDDGKPITAIEQLLIELAISCESHKTVVNMASTFKTVIRRLHIRKEAGVELLRRGIS